MNTREIFYLSKTEKEEVIKKLIEKSHPSAVFYILISLASFIAAIALILNNVAILVGSMLIAPILYPIVFLGLNITLYNFGLIKSTILIIGKIMLLGILIGFTAAVFLKPFTPLSEIIIVQGMINLPLFYVAVGSGLAAALATTRKSLQEILPGVAVSISLIPPLINVGVALGFGQFSVASGSLQLFIINIFGVIFASLIVFSLMGFVTERKIATKTPLPASAPEVKEPQEPEE